MDDDAALRVLRGAARRFADCAARDPTRQLTTYAGWSIADLILHTGRIHRWVTEVVRTRATRRLPQPDLIERPRDLIGWFRDGAAGVADTLAATDPATPVWTFAGTSTAGFWRRRMALETTIHRWDVERAIDDMTPIADAVATAGVTEALTVYLEPRLRGADVGGGGEIVVLRAAGSTPTWVVRLDPDAVEVLGTDHPADVWIEAPPTDLWLFLMGRAGHEALGVRGPRTGVELLERAVSLLPTPAR